jgi:hypothetical protein
MLPGFIGCASFGVPAIVAGEAIAATAAGEGVKKSFAFVQLAKAKIEQAGALTIDQRDAQAGERSLQLRQGF